MHIYSFWLNTNRKKFIFCKLLFENLPLKKLVLVARNNEKVFHCRHFLHLFCRFLWKKTANWCISLYFRAEISHLFRAYERSNVFLLPPPPPPCKTEARDSRKWLIHYQIFLFHACSAHLWFESCLVFLCIRRPYLDKSSALPRAQSLKTTWFHATLDNKHYKITDLSQWLIDNSKEIEIFTFIS